MCKLYNLYWATLLINKEYWLFLELIKLLLMKLLQYELDTILYLIGYRVFDFDKRWGISWATLSFSVGTLFHWIN
jgi:hypothetical protein